MPFPASIKWHFRFNHMWLLWSFRVLNTPASFSFMCPPIFNFFVLQALLFHHHHLSWEAASRLAAHPLSTSWHLGHKLEILSLFRVLGKKIAQNLLKFVIRLSAFSFTVVNYRKDIAHVVQVNNYSELLALSNYCLFEAIINTSNVCNVIL